MGLKFKYKIWDLDEISESYNDLYDLNNEMKEIINEYLKKEIVLLEEGECYFIYFNIPEHVNLIFIDMRQHYKWEYYFYEPHMPKKCINQYEIEKIVDSNLSKYGFNKQVLPDCVLTQHKLPLCYMYVLHLFICLFLKQNDCFFDNKKYSDNKEINNIYIIDFTKKVLDLCYHNNLITDSNYYLLTNNVYKICENNINSSSSDLFLKTCDANVILYLLEKNLML